MKRHTRPFRLLLSFVIVLGSLPARADPVLEFQFIGSGQTFSPTDVVIMRGKLTNIGDAFTNRPAFGNVGPVPSEISSQYYADYPPGLAPGPTVLFSLDKNESIEWAIAHFSPWPLTGDLGDPVLTGQYVFPLDKITTDILPCDQSNVKDVASKTNASDFTWTVMDQSGAVPLPSSHFLLLLGLGLLTIFRVRHRRPSYFSCDTNYISSSCCLRQPL